MEVFEKVLHVMAFGSVGFSLLNVYLTINKLWKRKHLKVVAESISVAGRLVAFMGGLILSLNLLLDLEWLGGTNRMLFVILAVIQVFIGIGFWIESEQRKGFFQLLRESLSNERKESAELAKSFFRPSNAELVLEILTEVALIDEVLDIREREFIQAFADSWKIKISWEEIDKKFQKGQFNYDRLRSDMIKYLQTNPREQQVSQLADLLTLLVNIDDEVSEEEDLILAELTGLIYKYLDAGKVQRHYDVALIPQDQLQEEEMTLLLKDISQKCTFAGGEVFRLGPYFSQKYAQIICDKYRSMEYFSIWFEVDAPQDEEEN